jgi:spoIIIJ-associated protein
LKEILRKKIEEQFFIDLDINDYKKKKTEYLKEVARTTADDVSLTKKEKQLAPMPAYERRIIHLELADRSDVITESIGEEPERSVIVKPKI